MKQYILTGESAKKFMGMKNHNEKKLKERIDNMTKIKVGKAVASFIDDYARNMSHDENWKDKLLVDHSITYRRGFEGEPERVKVLMDISPMKLAEILHNGYEIDYKYNKDNLPKYLRVKHYETSEIYNLIIYKNSVFVEYKMYNGKSESTEYSLREVLAYLNDEKWIIEE